MFPRVTPIFITISLYGDGITVNVFFFVWAIHIVITYTIG